MMPKIVYQYINVNEFRCEIFNHIKALRAKLYSSQRSSNYQKIKYHGKRINLNMHHVVMLSKEECYCDICGVKASYLTITENADNPEVANIELWCIDQTRMIRRMTVDHKLARGLGGRDWFSNMVTMCHDCNSKKSTIESKLTNHNRCIDGFDKQECYPFECNFYIKDYYDN